MKNFAQNLCSPSPPLLYFGSIPLKGRAFLAPMAGVTDSGMRYAAAYWGASLVFSEMIGAHFFTAANDQTRLRAQGSKLEPHIIQIAGREPTVMAEAARRAEAAGAHAIDINMGCPAKKVVGGSGGAALMREPDLAAAIVRAIARAVQVPVSVKMRLGWDADSLSAADLAHRVESEGAALITVHGRTREQFYNGLANWSAIRAVKQAVTVPVVANGDCTSAADAAAMLRESGADAVMVGRAAVGQPWLVGEIASALSGETARQISFEEKRNTALEHYESLLSNMGVAQGVRHARKHLAAYAAAAKRDGALALSDNARQRLVRGDNPKEIRRLLSACWLESFKED